jgi:hypothetical protein
MDHRTYHQEKKSVRQMHQPLSSVSNMGRSGTQIVYYGNWKRLLQDKRRHEEDSINIENFNKVVETLNMKNPVHKFLDFPQQLLKQYKDPFGSLPHMDRRKESSSKIFFVTTGLQTFFVVILQELHS